MFLGVFLCVFFWFPLSNISFLLYGLFVVTLILFQGQHYLKLKLYRLTNVPFEQEKNLVIFRKSKTLNIRVVVLYYQGVKQKFHSPAHTSSATSNCSRLCMRKRSDKIRYRFRPPMLCSTTTRLRACCVLRNFLFLVNCPPRGFLVGRNNFAQAYVLPKPWKPESRRTVRLLNHCLSGGKFCFNNVKSCIAPGTNRPT